MAPSRLTHVTDSLRVFALCHVLLTFKQGAACERSSSNTKTNRLSGVMTFGRGLRQVLLGCWRGSPVAVKLLKEDIVQTSPSALANFQREAKLLQDLRHPNVIGFFGSCLEAQPVWLPISC